VAFGDRGSSPKVAFTAESSSSAVTARLSTHVSPSLLLLSGLRSPTPTVCRSYSVSWSYVVDWTSPLEVSRTRIVETSFSKVHTKRYVVPGSKLTERSVFLAPLPLFATRMRPPKTATFVCQVVLLVKTRTWRFLFW